MKLWWKEMLKHYRDAMSREDRSGEHAEHFSVIALGEWHISFLGTGLSSRGGVAATVMCKQSQSFHWMILVVLSTHLGPLQKALFQWSPCLVSVTDPTRESQVRQQNPARC
ncbi:unnamed protein product [Discosporangium mesarthrocarpum]